MLDWIFGSEHGRTLFKKEELLVILNNMYLPEAIRQADEQIAAESSDSGSEEREANGNQFDMFSGVLSLKEKKIRDVM